MINNDSLFEHFRGARRSGYRSGWTRPARVVNPAVQQVLSVYVQHGMPEPDETITETDVLDPERESYWRIEECGLCGEKFLTVDMHGDVCWPCERAERADYEETMRGVNAYLDYQQFAGLARDFNSNRY